MTAVSLAVMLGFAVLATALGGSTFPVELFLVGPLLVATRGTPRTTAAVSVGALALALAVAAINGSLGETDVVTGLGVVVVGGVLAVWIAALRSASEDAEREQHSAREELQVMLGAVADGITAQDRTGRVVYANEAAARAMGFSSPEELLQTPPEQLLDRFEIIDLDGRPFSPERLPGRLALAGEAPTPATVRFRSRLTGEERYVVVKAQPVMGPDGAPDLAINVLEDVTVTKLAERAQRFLADVSAALAETLDYDATVRALERVTVPAIAARAEIDEVPPSDPDRGEAVRAVLRTGTPQLRPDLIVAPLVARGRTLAALSLIRDPRAAPYDAHDLEVAVEFARRGGLALANARLFSDRAHTARALQESLLPPVLPAIPGLEVAARFRAAGTQRRRRRLLRPLRGRRRRVGARRRRRLRQGRRRGRGHRAGALHDPRRRHAALLPQPHPQPAQRRAAAAAHRRGLLHGRARALRHPPPTAPSSCWPAAGTRCRCCSAQTARSSRSAGRGSLLGVLDEPDLRDEALELDPGDSVIFYTDGVTEAGAPLRILEPEALEALVAACHGLEPAALAARIERAAAEATGGELRDDIAILVARVRPVEIEGANEVRGRHRARGPADQGLAALRGQRARVGLGLGAGGVAVHGHAGDDQRDAERPRARTGSGRAPRCR